MRRGRLGSGMALVLTVVAVGAGCTGKGAEGAAPAAHTSPTAAPSPPPDSLPVRIRAAIKGDLGYSVKDATDLDRPVDMRHLDLWRSCFSRKTDGGDAVDFWAVPYAEKCPAHRKAHVPTPKTPDVTGQDFARAYDVLLRKGYAADSIDVFYGTGGALNDEDVSRVDGQVCKQSPEPGQSFHAREDDVELYVAVGKCPRR
ncbi:PASTA domain-containing protein [Streptomyces sp. NPDC046939]|uniref:PASTA domain-containing protein n=1 Tax=Streptomyces sp. NPDC046939 TaxID=3155376 RepID=UPI0033C5B790